MAKDKSQKKVKNVDSKPITTDSRFKSVHSDPRFKQPRFNNAKVKVDERFSRKELDRLNLGSGGKKVKVDRYGRKIKDEESKFDKYFKEESSGEEEESASESEDESGSEDEDEHSDKAKASQSASGSESSGSDSESESESEDDGAVAALDRARGEGLQSSSDDSDSSSDSDSDSDDEIEYEESDLELEETKPEEGDPSHSFAVVNMDWDNIRAVDLMATFNSFVPKNGLIKSITIYPSEFGKEQMQKEEVEGPPRELFRKKSKKGKKEEDSDDSDEEIDTKSAAGLQRAAKKLYEEDNGEEDYDSKALRRYQLQRLRYYYAVVVCDSVATAKNIYDSCDGTEYESTANIFDLRYIPDGMDFDDSEARDQCTKLPSNYRPSMFVTDALQHSKVKLTWDETPKERLAVAGRQFSQKEIEEMDFKAYLASDSEEEEAENESAKDKYKMLLGGKSFGATAEDEEDSDVDVEISFTPGLAEQEAAAERAKEIEERELEEDSITAYKRKQKERRKARMEKFKERQKDSKIEEEPVKEKSKKGKKSKKEAPQDEKSKAELELLMMNENDEQEDNHFSMKDIIKSEKKKNKKNKHKNKDDVNVQEDFEIDLNDDRFNEIFENREYNIDPTSTDFKKTKTMKKILDERSKRQNHEGSERPSKKQKPEKEQKKPNELGSLVEKLKRKNLNRA